jgi:hypothetical protein
MLESLHVENLGPFKTLDINFGSRLNLITGDNGIGKSFIVDLCSRIVDLRHPPDVKYFARKKQTDIVLKWTLSGKEYSFTNNDIDSDRCLPLKICFLANNTFEACDALPSIVNVFIQSTPLEKVWQGWSPHNGSSMNGVIRDWETWQKDDLIAKLQGSSETTSFSLFMSLLKSLWEDSENFPVPSPKTKKSLKTGDLNIPVLQLPYGDILITDLSAGMKRIIGIAYSIFWFIEQHHFFAHEKGFSTNKKLLILIDEVELHLHPKWQRKILPALLEAVKCLDTELQVQIIATTHSPMVVNSLDPHFDPTQDKQFTLVMREDGHVECQEIDFRPRGNASDCLESSVFNTTAGTEEREAIIKKVQEALENKNLTLAMMATLEPDMDRLLEDTHYLWAGWQMRQSKLQREQSV